MVNLFPLNGRLNVGSGKTNADHPIRIDCYMFRLEGRYPIGAWNLSVRNRPVGSTGQRNTIYSELDGGGHNDD